MNTAEAFQIALDNQRLIAKMVRSGALNATKEEMEDLISSVTIEVVERLCTSYDPAKSKASTFCGMVARSRAIDMSRGRKHHAAFDVGADDSEEHYGYSAELTAPDNGVSAFEAREEIKLALGKLDGTLGGSEFALDCFSGEMETDEIATKYGISESTVYTRRNKIRAFLQTELSR